MPTPSRERLQATHIVRGDATSEAYADQALRSLPALRRGAGGLESRLMEKGQYLALVLREANAFVNAHEKALRASGGVIDETLGDALEEQLKAVLVEADYLEDVLKWSELRDVPREVWRGAEDWSEVVAGAAMTALAYDVAARARDIAQGRMPSMDNIQL